MPIYQPDGQGGYSPKSPQPLTREEGREFIREYLLDYEAGRPISIPKPEFENRVALALAGARTYLRYCYSLPGRRDFLV